MGTVPSVNSPYAYADTCTDHQCCCMSQAWPGHEDCMFRHLTGRLCTNSVVGGEEYVDKIMLQTMLKLNPVPGIQILHLRNFSKHSMHGPTPVQKKSETGPAGTVKPGSAVTICQILFPIDKWYDKSKLSLQRYDTIILHCRHRTSLRSDRCWPSIRRQ